jgi:predicted O-methyltransferase YrrM
VIVPTGSIPSPITGVPGALSEAEQGALLALARDIAGPAFIVEIGAQFGQSASLFLAGNNHRKTLVTSVDLFPGDMRSIYISNLIEAGFGATSGDTPGIARAVPVQGYSTVVAEQADWLDGQIDLLFIDGDHTYTSVMSDIQAWGRHVKVGGRVAFHDFIALSNFQQNYLFQFDVTWAVAEWFIKTRGDWRQYKYVDRLAVFERVK